MQWTEVQITTTLEAEDAVVDLFYESGAQGVAIEDYGNLQLIQKDPTVNYIDESILNTDPNQSIIRGYFNETLNCDACVHQLLEGIKKLPTYGLNPGSCEMAIKTIQEEDWANSWKEYYKPTKIGKQIVIKPTWEPYTPKADEIVINMDPGMAFGTGTHETTQLCVIELEKYVKPDTEVIDIGCGTGILSIIAAELHAKKVIGVDLDPVAVHVAKENMALNKLSNHIEILEGNLMDVLPEDQKADLVVANILAAAIVALTPAAKTCLKPGGIFISSGIITEFVQDVLEALEAADFTIKSIHQMGEWHCVVAEKKA